MVGSWGNRHQPRSVWTLVGTQVDLAVEVDDVEYVIADSTVEPLTELNAGLENAVRRTLQNERETCGLFETWEREVFLLGTEQVLVVLDMMLSDEKLLMLELEAEIAGCIE